MDSSNYNPNDKLILNDASEYLPPNKLNYEGRDLGCADTSGDYPKILNIFAAEIKVDDMKIFRESGGCGKKTV